MPIVPGSLVSSCHLSGQWRVKDVIPSRESHSVIPIFDAVLSPVGERRSQQPRRVPLVSCTMIPPALEVP